MGFEAAAEAVEVAAAGVGIVVVFVAVLLLLSNSADNFRTMLFEAVGAAVDVVLGDRLVEDIFEFGEVVRSMAGEDDADDVDSVSLFLCLLKENRLTRTSGFGDNTGGLLILASPDAFVSIVLLTASISLFRLGLDALPES